MNYEQMLKPGEIVIAEQGQVQELIEAAGCQLKYLHPIHLTLIK